MATEPDQSGREMTGGVQYLKGENVPVPDSDTTVVDPISGIPRKVFAGQPVPADLLEAYAEETGSDPYEKAELRGAQNADERQAEARKQEESERQERAQRTSRRLQGGDEEGRAKAQRGARDKAIKAPETDK
jgi:hypothetical protein